ncbi:cbl-interacting serine/threonine-protein kinase [Anaeramoeba flamelloides]|uniref:Cbl-interacting serine/threonine-protein kinase n=1 Tax=Anaeramoeba flamelloides TaxID=1746091 RepID=A0AAV7YAG7_9EUKA|nr:cbl-interacting serine/threonine-protein kinase [Anaeramoeba flamelloides]
MPFNNRRKKKEEEESSNNKNNLNKANNLAQTLITKNSWLSIIDMAWNLHSLNYFHRDLRVSNIMVEKKESTIKNNKIDDHDNNKDHDKNRIRMVVMMMMMMMMMRMKIMMINKINHN